MYPWYILLVAFCIILSITPIWYWNYFKKGKKGIEDKDQLEQNKMNKLVGYATILTSIASTIVGIVSVCVMVEQSNIQKNLIARQESEHQPTFIIQKSLHKSDSIVQTYDYEEYLIKNIGERVKNIKNITDKTFIKISYKTPQNDITSYIPLQYYYQISFTTGEVQETIRYSQYSNYNKNNLHVSNLYNQALDYSLNNKSDEHIFVEKIQFFIISYVDIYDKEHTVYMQDNYTISREDYYTIEALSINDYGYHTYNVQDLDLDIFFNDSKQFKEYNTFSKDKSLNGN